MRKRLLGCRFSVQSHKLSWIHRLLDGHTSKRVQGNVAALLAALKACSSLSDLETGRVVHAGAVQAGDDSNVYVRNTLISMYAKCGSMVEAREVFERFPFRNVVSWNALIIGYADNEEGDLALALLSRMGAENIAADDRTFVAALKACTCIATKEEPKQAGGSSLRPRALEKGMAVHSQAASAGFESELFVGNTLIDMYAKCGSMVDARRVFDKMPNHCIVSWSALMMGYVENGHEEVALQLFRCLLQFTEISSPGCLPPNAVTFVAALKACASLGGREGKRILALETGIEIHHQAARYGLDSENFVMSTLVDMYAKCGSLVDAHRIIDRNGYNSMVSWNALIQGYAENGGGEIALDLFYHVMRAQGPEVNARTFVATLKACGDLAAKEDASHSKTKWLETGRAVHCQAAKAGYSSDIFVASTLVEMYGKCGSMLESRSVFDKTSQRDIVLWTALMLGYVENGQEGAALELYERLQTEGYTPNSRTYVVALKACSSLATKEQDRFTEGDHRKSVNLECLKKGMDIHSQAAQTCSNFGDIFLESALVDMYSKCGSLADARMVFERMTVRDVVSWTALMVGYTEFRQAKVALELFARMRMEGYTPDATTFVAALKACGDLPAMQDGKKLHAEICRLNFIESHAVIVNVLLDFYGKCGSSVEAQRIFGSVSTRDSVAWTSLIAAYSRQGDTKQVCRLFQDMQDYGVRPNDATFVCVLSACSHAGLVETGRSCFEAMQLKFGITPAIEHYICMVDILGRANQLDAALAMVKSMPLNPNALMWRTVLGACWKWTNAAVGRLAFESLLELGKADEVAHLLMEHINKSALLEEKQG